jgi:hypothetical protein
LLVAGRSELGPDAGQLRLGASDVQRDAHSRLQHIVRDRQELGGGGRVGGVGVDAGVGAKGAEIGRRGDQRGRVHGCFVPQVGAVGNGLRTVITGTGDRVVQAHADSGPKIDCAHRPDDGTLRIQSGEGKSKGRRVVRPCTIGGDDGQRREEIGTALWHSCLELLGANSSQRGGRALGARQCDGVVE